MVARLALIKELAQLVPQEVLVVTSIGNNSYFWAELTDRAATLVPSTLGMCTPAAFGLAMALPRRRVLALDSDGNLILNLGALGTIANENPTTHTVLVLDNEIAHGSHKKDPGMRTASGGKLKLQEVAKGCGIVSSHVIQDVATFSTTIKSALKSDGPHFVCARVEALDGERPPKTKHVLDPRENKYQFAKYIERTE